MPPSGQRPLPNVLNERTETQGSSVADRYFEFDTATGFLKGSFVYDPAKDVALVSCRYDDGDGNAYRELTKTVASSSPPARTYCSNTYPELPERRDRRRHVRQGPDLPGRPDAHGALGQRHDVDRDLLLSAT